MNAPGAACWRCVSRLVYVPGRGLREPSASEPAGFPSGDHLGARPKIQAASQIQDKDRTGKVFLASLCKALEMSLQVDASETGCLQL